MTKVVHVHHAPFDFYIGRPHAEFPRGSAYENPFHVGRDGNRVIVLDKFVDWWYHDNQRWLRERAMRELKDKTLGCWCKDPNRKLKDQGCHGDIIAEFVDRAVSADRPFFPSAAPLHVG